MIIVLGESAMSTPSPDRITLEPARRRWRALFNGHVLADSNDALVLREQGYPDRIYFPRDDVGMEYASRTQRTSHCPFKGDATYYTFLMDGDFAENAAWSYERPIEGMAAIAGRISFYPDKVEVYAVDDAAVNPRHAEEARERPDADVDTVVQHTDAGDGAAQRERWRENVETPGAADDGGLR